MAIKKIIVFRNDRFGEFLLIIPALRALKRSYPGASLTVVAHPSVKPLAAVIEGVNEVLAWENRLHRFAEIMKFAFELKKKRFDLSVVFNPSKESHLVCFLAGIRIRLGYRRKWGFLLTKSIRDTKDSGLKHEVESNCELLQCLGIEVADKALSLSLDESKASDLLKDLSFPVNDRLVVIHPWTSDPVKQWPLENFKCLIEAIGKELEVTTVLIGGQLESLKGFAWKVNPGQKIHDLTGKTSLVQLAALLKKSRLLVSADSGPVHLAACVGTAVIALFRNDIPGKRPRRWGPWGKGHHVIAKENISDITVAEVFAAVKEKLGSDKR
ncbi:MAG: glycosyltransferase family 9 protein [Candidatus Omnitrophota bacterium]|jgi:ADP-heptose:LPS heptosyltransferase